MHRKMQQVIRGALFRRKETADLDCNKRRSLARRRRLQVHTKRYRNIQSGLDETESLRLNTLLLAKGDCLIIHHAVNVCLADESEIGFAGLAGLIIAI